MGFPPAPYPAFLLPRLLVLRQPPDSRMATASVTPTGAGGSAMENGLS
jgi:hypothetical protein